jgi:hypothetical protein
VEEISQMTTDGLVLLAFVAIIVIMLVTGKGG